MCFPLSSANSRPWDVSGSPIESNLSEFFLCAVFWLVHGGSIRLAILSEWKRVVRLSLGGEGAAPLAL